MAIDIAADEYDQAAAHFEGSRSGAIFGRASKRGRAAIRGGSSSGEFMANLRNGFAFNLPIVALGGLALCRLSAEVTGPHFTMSRSILFKEDLELNQIRAGRATTSARAKRNSRKSARSSPTNARSAKARCLRSMKSRSAREAEQHEQTVSRGEVTNVRRDQNRSLMLLFLLLAATCTL